MAIAATAVWEVRTTGSDTNGGGFDASVASPGTDYSQQAAAQYSLTNGVANGTTTLATVSASADMNGNIVYVAGGTGSITAGWYEVTAVVVGVSLTVDRSTGLTAGTGVTLNVGGALLTIAKAAALVVAGNAVWVRAGSGYSISAALTFSTGGAVGSYILWQGYTSARGDGGQVTVSLTATTVNMFSITGNLQRFWNFIADCATKDTSEGFNISAAAITMVNCLAKNFTKAGFITDASSRLTLRNCVCTLGTSAAASGAFQIAVETYLSDCRATTNACPGFSDIASAAASSTYLRCISDNNTGASSIGFTKNSSGSTGTVYDSCISYKNGSHGWDLFSASAGDSCTLRNCISYGNAGFGIIASTTISPANNFDGDYNAYGSNTSGARSGIPAGPHDVTLTADPFTNGASNDFSLNATANAGAACRAAGFPGVLQSGGTGFIDIGALQHQDSGSSGMLFIPNLEGT